MRLAQLPRRAALALVRLASRVAYARALGVRVGKECKLISTNFGSEPYLVTLGDRVEVTQGVQFVTHDGGVWALRDVDPELDVVGPITVGDHAFIGVNAIILPGVTIGHHAVVAAGSVVTRDVPAETVVAGVPARRLCGLAEYREKSRERSLGTKGLSPAAKEEFLRRHFGR